MFIDKGTKRIKRAYQRFMMAAGFPGQYRLLTLTTPEQFDGDIHHAWQKWVQRMRRRGMAREYYTVKEWNKKHTCRHLHVALRVPDHLTFVIARQQWQAVTGAEWIGLESITTKKGMINYLCKYLTKSIIEEPIKRSFWYSWDWIYRKWRFYTKSLYKVGELVKDTEHEFIRSLATFFEKVEWMNYRMLNAYLLAALDGRISDMMIPEIVYKV